MAPPPVSLVRRFDTHRLVPSKHLPRGESVLTGIADDDEHLRAIFELDAATNDRLLAEHQRAAGIGLDELVSGIPCASVVNAAFCHPHPLGARFSSATRGAWYAAFDLETSQAEVAFHRSIQLAEIDRVDDTATYDDYLADFSASFHDLCAGPGHSAYLSATSYVESQLLAERLLDGGSLGVVYPSVRHTGGTCIACFRPALVMNVRRARTYEFVLKRGGATWRADRGAA
jgi:hypothetical protein